MRSLTSVDLAFSWPEAPKHLPRRWVAVLDPYVDQEQSSIVSARLTFHSTDPILEDFLAFAEQEKAREPGTGGLLGRLGLRGPSVPLGHNARPGASDPAPGARSLPSLRSAIDSGVEYESIRRLVRT